MNADRREFGHIYKRQGSRYWWIKFYLGRVHGKPRYHEESSESAMCAECAAREGPVQPCRCQERAQRLLAKRADELARHGVPEPRVKLNADLNTHVEGWKVWAARTALPATVAKYEAQVRVLMPADQPFPRSQFTRKAISQALAKLPGSGSTARRYHAAWSSFANYLVEMEVLDGNLLRLVRAPKPNGPKELWLELADVKRLVEAQPEPFRTLAALREGSGMEISAALRTRRSDVDLPKGIVHAHGTKNAWRDRLVRLDGWALPYVKRFLRERALTPQALLFEGISYGTAREHHKSALQALALDSRYTLHDARHSFAVREMKRGTLPQVIASQLGHKDAMLVLKVYGKYQPTVADLERSQRVRTGTL